MGKLKVIELFAGIGAWSKALKRMNIDFEVVNAIEIDEKTMQSYNAIHNTNFKAQDITNTNEKELHDCDLICYSPPCQSWSKGGTKSGFDDERGILFFDALRIIREKQPKIAIMENVHNLADKKFKSEFKEILESLENVGYVNHYKIVNALDLGFPQHRKRVFIVSIRKDLDIDFKFPDNEELSSRFIDLLEKDWDKSYLHSEKGIAYMDRVTTKNRTHWDFGHHNDTDRDYSMCIVSNFKKGVPYNVLIDRRNGTYIRKHTPLEVMRLMGYDDCDYRVLKDLKLRDNFIYVLAGNSIVVNVCEKIFKEISIINNYIRK